MVNRRAVVGSALYVDCENEYQRLSLDVEVGFEMVVNPVGCKERRGRPHGVGPLHEVEPRRLSRWNFFRPPVSQRYWRVESQC